MNIVRRKPLTPHIDGGEHLAPLLQRIYAARGVSSVAELDLALAKLLPFHTMKGIEQAADILAEGIVSNKRLMVVGDFDADGATSTALAVLALRAFGAQQVDYRVPNRFDYGYGLSPELVADIASVGESARPQILMTVDNGISSIEGVAAAQALGMQVIVTDHHLAGETLPSADAIVNPNQSGCEFAAKGTAGVGVCFYVLSALRSKLKQQHWFDKRAMPNLADYLDIVALGTVADVVPLEQNNRILIDQGVRRIRAGRCRPGIVALLEVAKRECANTVAADMGFAVAPRLNAAGRLEDMSLGIECLLSDDIATARSLACELDSMNLARREIEADMQEQALAYLQKIELAQDLPKALCLFNEDWHQGVIGILASRIKERCYRPVIAFADGGEGTIKGSARSIQGFHLRDALALVDNRHPGLISKFGGHAMAAGLSLNLCDLATFSQAFEAVADELLSEEALQALILSDGELGADEFSLATAEAIRSAGPWGQNFLEPIFDGVFGIVSQRIVGQKHLKLELAVLDSGQSIDAIAFNVDLKAWPNENCKQVRVAYKLDINHFRGRQSLQLMVESIDARCET